MTGASLEIQRTSHRRLILSDEFQFVKFTRNVVLLFMLGAVGCVIVGGVFFGVCGGGISLILFGVAAALVGVIVAALGGYAVAVPMAIVVLILTLAGAYFAAYSGCGL